MSRSLEPAEPDRGLNQRNRIQRLSKGSASLRTCWNLSHTKTESKCPFFSAPFLLLLNCKRISDLSSSMK